MNNPIIADSEFPESGEFPRERRESVGLLRQMFFDFSQDPFRLVLACFFEIAFGKTISGLASPAGPMRLELDYQNPGT
jgi:hypothetical protein